MDIDLKIFNILTDEQKEAVMTAQTPEELIALAKEQGYELTDEDMMAVATGWGAMIAASGSVAQTVTSSLPSALNSMLTSFSGSRPLSRSR